MRSSFGPGIGMPKSVVTKGFPISTNWIAFIPLSNKNLPFL